MNIKDESGSALVDLVGFGLLLQIPVLLFAITALEIQRQNIALESIARHGLRSFVLTSNRDTAKQVIDQLALDFSLTSSKLDWEIYCQPDPDCQDFKSLAYLEVTYEGQYAITASQIGTSR